MFRLILSTLFISILSLALWIGFTGLKSAENEKNIKSTTGGELTFTIRTVTAGGNYSPKHVLAIWIENDGDFIKTRKAMANQRKQYLYTWKNASNYNVVDAITGSTLTTHQTHTVSWDCTDLDGDIVPDGEYDVYAEFTDKHAQGPLYTLSFTKGPDGVSFSPADETYFKDIELDFIPFVSEFSSNLTSICQGETVTFTDGSVNATSWDWNFGEGADPATADSQGPHTVTYSSAGAKTISLTVNGSVTETKDDFIAVAASPVADYTFSSFSLTVDFTNLSANATTYLWDFGDGNTSTDNNPTHTYALAGTYDVSLTAIYMTCEDINVQEILVPLVGVGNLAGPTDVLIAPNPNSGLFTMNVGNITHIKKIDIFAASGERIQLRTPMEINTSHTTVDARELEKGIYFLRITTEDRVITKKIMIR